MPTLAPGQPQCKDIYIYMYQRLMSVCQNVLSSKGHDSARLSCFWGMPIAFAALSHNVNIAEQKLWKYGYRF